MDTPLTLDLRSYSRETHRHQHDYHQLVLPVAGELQMQVGGREGRVGADRAAVIAAGREHGFAAPDRNRFLVADVPAALAPALERLPAFIHLDPALAQYVVFLQLQLQQGGACQGQMLLLLLQLLQERAGEPPRLDRRIAAARDYLDRHYPRPVTLAEVAQAAHLSPRQLGELFRRELGLTPRQYLTEKRMQTAWRLLAAGELGVQRVAEAVGYASLAAFSDRFRRHFGRAPSHFRRRDKALRP